MEVKPIIPVWITTTIHGVELHQTMTTIVCGENVLIMKSPSVIEKKY